MGKSVFTVLFLAIALFAAIKVQTFVKNNKEAVNPEGIISQTANLQSIAQDESDVVMPADTTTGEASTTTLEISTTTEETPYTEGVNY